MTARSTRTRLSLGALVLPLLLIVSSCSKSDSSDTTGASDTTAVVETEAPETAAEETTAPETEAGAAEETAGAEVAGATEAAGGDSAAGEAIDQDAMLSAVLSGLLGSEIGADSLSCIKDKMGDEALAGLPNDEAALKPMMKAVLDCEPETMAKQFVNEAFEEYPEMTDDQKACMGEGMVDAMKSDEVLDAMFSNADSMPASLLKTIEDLVKGCVPEGDLRAKLIEELKKN